MIKPKILVLIVAIVSILSAQTKILLCDFENRGVDTTLIRTTTQLLKDALNSTYKYVVVEQPSGIECYGVVTAANYAKRIGAAKALIGNIMQIGSKTYHSYQFIDANSGSVELADKIETPALEEFPTMCDRIAKAIVEKRTFGETVEPEKVISPEVEPGFRRPRKPYTSIFLTAGYLFYPFLENDRKFEKSTGDSLALSRNLVNLNVAVSFETQQLLTMMQVGLLRGKYDEKDINFDLMVHYVLGKGDFSPITGFGAGITRYSWKDPSNGQVMHDDGLTLSAGLGVIGLRTYYFRLLGAVYGNCTFTNNWGAIPGLRIMFGVTSPTLGPDAQVRIGPACVGGLIGGIFLTGIIIALTS